MNGLRGFELVVPLGGWIGLVLIGLGVLAVVTAVICAGWGVNVLLRDGIDDATEAGFATVKAVDEDTLAYRPSTTLPLEPYRTRGTTGDTWYTL